MIDSPARALCGSELADWRILRQLRRSYDTEPLCPAVPVQYTVQISSSIFVEGGFTGWSYAPRDRRLARRRPDRGSSARVTNPQRGYGCLIDAHLPVRVIRRRVAGLIHAAVSSVLR
jgi:hypothetical protein